MCIAYFQFDPSQEISLFIAANRDEFYQRHALGAAPWEDYPAIIAGRDLSAGGTWLGINKSGEVGFLTNIRDPKNFKVNSPSRGHLISNFLKTELSAITYLEQLNLAEYNGFNLVLGNKNGLYYCNNDDKKIHQLEADAYSLSNHYLNTPWPKTEYLKKAFKSLDLQEIRKNPELAFEILKYEKKAPDQDLPQTGVSLELERLLSSPFIHSPDYGTRCSTLVFLYRSGKTVLIEREYDNKGMALKDRQWEITS